MLGTYSNTRVVTGTTSDKQESSAPSDDGQVSLETSEGDASRVKVDSSSHSVDDRFRLFVNLLLHKVVELSLHDLGELDLEGLDSSNRRKSVVLAKSVDVKFTFANVSNVIILEVQDSLGVLNDCRGIRGDEKFDRLRQAILGKEGSGLRTTKLGSAALTIGNGEQATVLSVVGQLLDILVGRELDVNKVDLELPVSLDTDQERRTTTTTYNLVWEMTRFENKSKGTFEFLDDRLDEVGKVQSLVGLRVVDVVTKHSNGFGISVGAEGVSSLLEHELNLLVVGDDTIVNQTELVAGIAGVRVAVQGAGLTVSSPSSVGHRGLSDKGLGHVDNANIGRFLGIRLGGFTTRLLSV